MKHYESPFNICALAILAAVVVFVGNATAGGSTEKVLYSFGGGADGSAPYAGLVADADGNLYGTTADGGTGACQGGCGTVFELSLNPNGTWSETQLHSFTAGNDGAAPEGGVVLDAAGNLYGTTIHGGTSNDGIVFRMTPPTKPGGAWTETILYNFVGARDGEYSLGSLVFDPAGNLYGATIFGGHYGGGTVFRVVPPRQGNTWSLTVLHAFKGVKDGLDPLGALVLDAQGTIYGTNYDGIVFRLKPPAKGKRIWSLKELYQADSVLGGGGLLPGNGGVFYGTSSFGGGSNAGTVFQLTKRSATILYEFSGGSDGSVPLNGLIADSSGNLYGATQTDGVYGAGTVFKMSPPAQGGAWTKTTLYSFQGGTDGAGPDAGVIFGGSGVLYGTTESGGSSGNGTVFEVTP